MGCLPPLLIPEQQRRIICVLTELKAWKCLQRGCERNGIVRRTGLAFPHSKGKRHRPTPKVSIQRILLFLHYSFTQIEVMSGPHAPIFAEAIINAAVGKIVTRVGAESRNLTQI